jgi:hypothetical protein
MKAEELRIGNLVLIPYNKSNKQEGFFEATISQIGDFGAYIGPEDYEPILLTEEWLLKFGFYETSNQDFIGGLYTQDKPDKFFINKETMSYCFFDYEGSIDDIIQIKYVHQLQNLYFALTGEELQLQENTTEGH